jgi:hypothetical protein
MRRLARAVVAAVTIAALAFPSAFAAPPPNADPRLHAWFERQHSIAGAWCCNISDGHLLGDTDWKTVGSGYAVRIKGVWYAVPASAIRDPGGGPNPTGRAIVWYNEWTGGVKIWCFSPGWEG